MARKKRDGQGAELPLVITITRPDAPVRGKTKQVVGPAHTIPVITPTHEELVITTIRYPRYIGRLMEEWMRAHPGHTKTSMILNALRLLDLPIEAADLVPQRVRGVR